MGKSTKDGRRKSGSMPTVRIDRKNKQARVFIGGKQHHLGRVEGGKISPAQAAEAARIWYQLLNELIRNIFIGGSVCLHPDRFTAKLITGDFEDGDLPW